MSEYQRRIVYLSESQKDELFENGSVTVGGVTINYSDSDVYVTPQVDGVTDVQVGGTSVVDTHGVANIPNAPVQDVQVNGVSVLQDGVANVPIADSSNPGVVKIYSSYGIVIDAGRIAVSRAADGEIKSASGQFKPIVPTNQHKSVFYGLAKAAGDVTQSASSNPVGQYTDSAKSAISTMLNGSVPVSGSTPTIAALPGICYVCGEVATLDITLPASGIVDVTFESGSAPTVLTVTPPTGMTVEWANGFDSTSLEADTLYELNIKMVGTKCLGVAGQWT